MLQLDRGKAMRYLTDLLGERGYTWAYRVVDTRAFGFPQRRRRVIVLASKTEDPRQVLFADDAGEPSSIPDWSQVACGFYWTERTRGLGLNSPVSYRRPDRPLAAGERWPIGAWGRKQETFVVDVSSWPVKYRYKHLREFLKYEPRSLSARATAGFLRRAHASRLRFVDGFLEDVAKHARAMGSDIELGPRDGQIEISFPADIVFGPTRVALLPDSRHLAEIKRRMVAKEVTRQSAARPGYGSQADRSWMDRVANLGT